MDKKILLIGALVAGAVIGAAGAYWIVSVNKGGGQGEEASPKTARKILYWQAPMDPTFTSDKPGKSPMGMDLVPVYEDEVSGGRGVISIDSAAVQTIGVKSALVEKRELRKKIKTVGRITYDETKLFQVHGKVDGWIEKLYVNATGAAVKKDDILLSIYSPTLVSAEEEYLLALKNKGKVSSVGGGSFADIGRRRLELWDVPEHQIRELEKNGVIIKSLHIHSPAKGIVVDKPVKEGMYVSPGTPLYSIADISNVWVNADIYEHEIAWVKEGQEAEIRVAAYAGRVFKGKVSFVYPFIEEKTRTNKVRLEFDNSGGELKPDMYVDVTIASPARDGVTAVPAAAVIRTGERSVVIIDRGSGRFEPRSIVTGLEAEGYFEVVSGLSEGDKVVTSAQFLIDSESSLRQAVMKMEAAPKAAAESGHEGMDHSSMDRGSTKHDEAERKSGSSADAPKENSHQHHH